MTHHSDEGPIEKIKDALDTDDHDDHSGHDHGAHGHSHDHDHDDEALSGDRPSGWAGVDEALGGTENRPAGPDYGAGSTVRGDDWSSGDVNDRDENR
jgi:hypothetical protein